MKTARAGISILVIICVFSIINGCAKAKEKKSEEVKQSFDVKVATNTLESYIGYLVNDDLENAKKLYSEELIKEEGIEQNKSLKICGYDIDEINEVGNSAIFKTKVSKSEQNNPRATLDMYSVTIESEEDEYKITKINSSTEKDAFVENQGIRVRDKNNVKTSLLIDLAGIPQFAYSQEDKTKINKIVVPKNKFGVMCFSYSGEKLAFSSIGDYAYIATVKIDETKATQAENSSGGAQGSSGGSSEGGSNIKTREVPIGKEIKSMDIIKNAQVKTLVYSKDEKYLAAEYINEKSVSVVALYNADSEEASPINFSEYFPKDKVDLKFVSFGKDIMNIEVVQNKYTEKIDGQYIGKWQIDLNKFKIKKL